MKKAESLTTKLDIDYPDDVPETFYEGAVKQIKVNKYERSKTARDKCIDHYGYQCSVCNMDFEKTYGETGKDYIHVHHITPISEIGERYKLDPVNDLRPVCPNYHAMFHRQKPSLTIDELKATMAKVQQ
ncbi:HNH endonuclease [Enterobacter asburiae]|uniref:HNH endonuclease n=1 Tax=Enterobacter asburiae TaxID=61645 RepID=UPI0035C5A833